MWEITAERKKHAETQGQKEAGEERGEGEIDIGRAKDTETKIPERGRPRNARISMKSLKKA